MNLFNSRKVGWPQPPRLFKEGLMGKKILSVEISSGRVLLILSGHFVLGIHKLILLRPEIKYIIMYL